MPTPLSQAARDRLRNQVRREHELAARVIAAEQRLADAIAKRDAVLAAQDKLVDSRRDEVADALVAYVDDAGLGLERAAMVLGRARAELSRIVRDRRAASRIGSTNAS